jgi:serine phosphatase RsbU (regulator of sigma subunit)
MPALPIGLGGGTPPVNEVVLERGDALLFYTEGAPGAVSASASTAWSTFWGRTLLSGLPPAELLRRLVAAVLEHTAHELHDDTTLLLVQRRDGKA